MPSFQITATRRENPVAHVFIAIPTYGHMDARCTHALIGAKDRLFTENISVDFATLTGNCHVDDARNDMVRVFLDSPATHMMFVDGDVIYSPDSIVRLIKHDKDVIGGVYPYKNDDIGFPYAALPGGLSINEQGISRVAGLPGGFMLMTRAVLEKAHAAALERNGGWQSKGSEKYATRPIAEVFYRSNKPLPIAAGQFTRQRLSGDYQFCADVTELGFEIWVDPQLTLGHIGDKTWTGSLIRHHLDKSGGWASLVKKAAGKITESDPDAVLAAAQTITDAFGNQPWACGPALTATLYSYASQPDVKTVLETGSGATTAMLRLSGKKVQSLEAEPIWGARTQEFLDKCEIKGEGAIVYAPLADRPFGRWYDFSMTYAPDLLFIDGPRRDAPGMRAHALDAMPKGKMPKFVIADDVDDGDGKLLVKRLMDSGYEVEVYEEPGRRMFAVAEKKAA